MVKMSFLELVRSSRSSYIQYMYELTQRFIIKINPLRVHYQYYKPRTSLSSYELHELHELRGVR